MPFECFVDYSSNFHILNAAMPDKKVQKQFIDMWKGIYKRQFIDSAPCEGYVWNIRCYRALKEIFSSAAMFGESLVAKDSKCWSSFYFTSYYSLFHAFLACVFLLPSESLEKLSDITHSKLLHIFRSSFCNGKFQIIDESICTAFSILRYQREYYSYHMPPNHFLYENADNIKPDVVLPHHLYACYQLANLFSLLIESAFEKHHKNMEQTTQNFQFVKDNFYLVNCRKHPMTEKYQLHYVDKVRLKETFLYPAPVSFIMELEHFSDEFGLYENSGFPQFADGKEFSPSRFIYDAIY